jgi:antitoxin MazE
MAGGRAMKVAIRRIGNSHGIVLPKPVLAQAGLSHEAELTLEGGAVVLRKPVQPVRAGWAAAAKRLAERGDDAWVMSEFANDGDAERTW